MQPFTDWFFHPPLNQVIDSGPTHSRFHTLISCQLLTQLFSGGPAVTLSPSPGRGGGQASEAPCSAAAGIREDAAEAGRHRKALHPADGARKRQRLLHLPPAGHRGRALPAGPVQVSAALAAGRCRRIVAGRRGRNDCRAAAP